MTESRSVGSTRAARQPAGAQIENEPIARLALRFGASGHLELRRGNDWVRVDAVRCFPWSQASRYISLRDFEGRELCLVVDSGTLEAASRWALYQALKVAGFRLEVTAVLSIEDDFEMRVWKVRTRGGERSFQTELDVWPQAAPGGGHVIEDIAGDVFFIPPLQSLDARSRKRLWPYVE